MRFSTRLPEHVAVRGFLMSVLFVLVGCAAPPSVAPLLRVTERVLLEEEIRLREDARRDGEQTRVTLESLEDGFNRDLEGTHSLTPSWVREATTVYIAARESVVEHQAGIARERENRADNLRAAAMSTRRAISLIERQDRLFDGVVGEDMLQLMSRAGLGKREPIQ